MTPGQTVKVDRLQVEPGNDVELDQVLLIAEEDKVVVGSPTVKGAKVLAKAVGEEKGDKVIVFRYKRKTRYRRKTGHRQWHTNLVISEIVTGGRRKAQKG